MEKCDQCGVEYEPLILERLAKGSRIGVAFELFVCVVLGGYALVYSYFSDSVLALLLCMLLAIALYNVASKRDENFCYACTNEQKNKK